MSASYFETAGIRLLGGRLFSGAEREGEPGVVVINQTLAKQVWRSRQPLGSRLRLAGENEWRQVVGVVADVRNRSMMSEPVGEIFIPCSQPAQSGPATADALRYANYVFRTRADPDQFIQAAREEIARIDPDQALGAVATVERVVEAAAEEIFLGAVLHAPLIALGLLLSGIGIYGILAFSVLSHDSRPLP